MSKERVIDRALRLAKGLGWDQSEFATRMDVGAQHITNWKKRGMPAGRHQLAASLLGITVDELVSGEAPVAKPKKGALFDELSAEEHEMLEDWRYILPEERQELRAAIALKAEHARAVVRHHMPQGLPVAEPRSAGATKAPAVARAAVAAQSLQKRLPFETEAERASRPIKKPH